MNAGNIYINRNIIGAIVGVQPFGGRGLSGTGPKAGGPSYVYRLAKQKAGAAPQEEALNFDFSGGGAFVDGFVAAAGQLVNASQAGAIWSAVAVLRRVEMINHLVSQLLLRPSGFA